MFRLLNLLWLLVGSTPALAIDLLPGDIRKPGRDTWYYQLNSFYAEKGTRYRDGDALPGDPILVSVQLQAGIGKDTVHADGSATRCYAQIPLGRVHPGGSLNGQENSQGWGDAVALCAYWPGWTLSAGHSLAIAGYLFAPTGEYSPQKNFNLGENRYRGALQVGYDAPVAVGWNGMIAADGQWFGPNTRLGSSLARLEQAPLWSMLAGIRYDPEPPKSLGLTYLLNYGGETQINGVSRNDTIALHRVQATAAWRMGNGKLSLMLGRDLATRNGYLEKGRVQLRYSAGF